MNHWLNQPDEEQPDWKKVQEEVWTTIPEEDRNKCLSWIREFFDDKLKMEIRQAHEERGDDWWVGLHFSWGMWMRNQMRTNGFGEKELGIGNLDDCYIKFVEEAVGL